MTHDVPKVTLYGMCENQRESMFKCQLFLKLVRRLNIGQMY